MEKQMNKIHSSDMLANYNVVFVWTYFEEYPFENMKPF